MPYASLGFSEGNLYWLGGSVLLSFISKAERALAARLVQSQRFFLFFLTIRWLCLLVRCLFGKYTPLCIYWCSRALSGSSPLLECRVITIFELSKVPLFEPFAWSVRIQLAVRACCLVAG